MKILHFQDKEIELIYRCLKCKKELYTHEEIYEHKCDGHDSNCEGQMCYCKNRLKR